MWQSGGTGEIAMSAIRLAPDAGSIVSQRGRTRRYAWRYCATSGSGEMVYREPWGGKRRFELPFVLLDHGFQSQAHDVLAGEVRALDGGHAAACLRRLEAEGN